MYKHFDKKTYCLLIVGLLLLSISLPGCAGTESLDPDYFQYANTEWNMTVDEVTSALALSEEDCTILVDDSTRVNPHYLLATDRLDFYGKNATTVFEFRQDKGNTPGLFRVYILFDNTLDHESVFAKLEKQLGKSKDYDIPVRLAEAKGHIGYWYGKEPILPYWEEAYAANDTVLPEVMAKEYKIRPSTRLYWTDNSDYYFDLINYQYQDVIRDAYGSKGMLVLLGELAIPLQYTADGLSK